MSKWETHPAWQEWFDAHPFAGEIANWLPGAKHDNPDDVWDWEVALWMTVHGYGADIRREEVAGVWWEETNGAKTWLAVYRYHLPTVTFEVDDAVDEERLPVNPDIDPAVLLKYHARRWSLQVSEMNGKVAA